MPSGWRTGVTCGTVRCFFDPASRTSSGTVIMSGLPDFAYSPAPNARMSRRTLFFGDGPVWVTHGIFVMPPEIGVTK